MYFDAAMAEKQIYSAGFPQFSSAESPQTDFNDLLVAVGRDRDKAAFAALFEYFAPRVKSFLMKGGLQPDLADELAQETMLTVWHKATAFDPSRAAASTWIFTIARNKKIDFLRKKSNQDLPTEDFSYMEADEPGPSDRIMRLEEEEHIQKALGTLPAEQLDLLKKSFFEGKTHAEIAEETNIPLGTVKSRIRLALERLRKETHVEALRS